MTNAGQNYQPTPLDFLILEELPDKGILGGVHWAGRPLKHVRQSINERLPDGADPVKVSTLQSRTRAMKVVGFVEDFASHGSGRIWARLPAGRAQLARKEAILGA